MAVSCVIDTPIAPCDYSVFASDYSVLRPGSDKRGAYCTASAGQAARHRWRATRPLGQPDGQRARHLRPAPHEPDTTGRAAGDPAGVDAVRAARYCCARAPAGHGEGAPPAACRHPTRWPISPGAVRDRHRWCPTVRSPGRRLPRPRASKKSGSAARVATSPADREPAGACRRSAAGSRRTPALVVAAA